MSMPAWSYSSLTKYETCPRQYQIVKVLKLVKDQPTQATIWGNEVHEALEFRVKDGTPLPATMAKYEPIAAKFANAKGEVFTELECAINRNMQPVAWGDPDCWYRGIIDVGVLNGSKAVLGDYKTGKVKDDHDQLELFSATYMTLHPEVEVSRSMYIWLAYDKLTRKDIKRDEVPSIWQKFIARSQRLENAYEKDKWLPQPSGLCRGWCPVGREHCEFWSPKNKK